MAEFKAALLYWKLAIFRVTGKALMAIALSVAQGLNGVSWGDFTPTQKFVTVTLAAGTGWAIIDAFLDQTLNLIRRNPKELGLPQDTEIIRRNEVAISQVETLKPSP